MLKIALTIVIVLLSFIDLNALLSRGKATLRKQSLLANSNRYIRDWIISSGTSTVDCGKSNNCIKLVGVELGWGDGSHPTTQLCFEVICDFVKPGMNVLDYGTGSGILSILAAKIGAEKCTAVDIDEETLLVAEENVNINGVAEQVNVVHTKSIYFGDDCTPQCDFTVANILPVQFQHIFAKPHELDLLQ